jgi:tetratricopeptide (TPR) repeat protein
VGFLDGLFGRAPSPDELWRRLRDAALEGNAAGLRSLCRKHVSLIAAHFKTWQNVPPEIRNDRAALDAYGRTLVSIAATFAQAGDGALMQLLRGGDDNPLDAWDGRIDEARRMIEQEKFGDAETRLADGLIDNRHLQGPGGDSRQALSFEQIGVARFHSGAASRAIEAFRNAVLACERIGDGEGVAANLGNLFEACRYAADAPGAADAASRLAGLSGEAGAARWRRRAEIVRAGEPLVRVCIEVGDAVHEIDEAPAPPRNGRVRFLFERNRVALAPAVRRTQEGERRGGAGAYEEALALFRDASSLDPHDPQAPYEAGVTLMHLERPSEAITEYERVEELAPGWFHSRAELALARAIVSGRLPHAVWRTLRALEDGGPPPAQRIALVEAVRTTGVASLHRERARALRDLGRSDEAVAAYRAGLACEADADTRTRLLADLAVALPRGAMERTALLEEAVRLGGNLVAAAQARYALKHGG